MTEVSADRGTISYTYDRRGLATSRTDGRGITVAYLYDNGGRLTKVDYPTGGIPDVTFTYDIAYFTMPTNANRGKVGRIVDGVIKKDLGFSPEPALNRVTVRNTYPLNRKYNLSESYDFEGNPLLTQYASTNQVLYDYDNDNRITRVRWKVGSTYTTLVDQITYRPNGPIASMRFGDLYTQTRSYDSSYRLTGVLDSNGPTTLRQLSYGYEGRDNLTAVTDLQVPANSETYAYTPRESLASASGPYGQMSFAYGGVGNRISHSRDLEPSWRHQFGGGG